MEFFALVDTVKAYCTARNWHFILGNSAMANYETSLRKYLPNDIVLIYALEEEPIRDNNKLNGVRYTGFIMFGRKRETTTKSNLDETSQQKYDLRFKELAQLLNVTITDIACTNDLIISGERYQRQENIFDENIDFIYTPLTFEQ